MTVVVATVVVVDVVVVVVIAVEEVVVVVDVGVLDSDVELCCSCSNLFLIHNLSKYFLMASLLGVLDWN